MSMRPLLRTIFIILWAEIKLSISYIDDVGIRNYKDYNESLGIMNQFDADSRLIFMLGEIISNYE